MGSKCPSGYDICTMAPLPTDKSEKTQLSNFSFANEADKTISSDALVVPQGNDLHTQEQRESMKDAKSV